MKNIDIIAKATKEAGITSEVHTFIAWKKQGLSVRKGEKAALTVDLWKKHGSRWYQEPTALFTREQVQTEEERKRPIIETVKETIPDIVKEDLPAVNENQHFRVDGKKFHMTAEKGKVKATFDINGINGLNKNDFRKFVKGYVETADDREAVTAYLMENIDAEKQVILSGKKAANTEVKKAIQIIGKEAKKNGRKVLIQHVNGKYYFTDSRMIIECREEDAINFLNANIAYSQNVAVHEGLEKLMNDITNAEPKEDIDFSKKLTEESEKRKVYKYGTYDRGLITAIRKEYIDCFKNKKYSMSSPVNPIYQVSENYKAAICPIRIS